jgi:hypothetical protein
MKKKQIQIGNDGYGYPNIVVTKEKSGISIIKKDPHNWGRVSESICLSENVIDDLMVFLLKIKQQEYTDLN